MGKEVRGVVGASEAVDLAVGASDRGVHRRAQLDGSVELGGVRARTEVAEDLPARALLRPRKLDPLERVLPPARRKQAEEAGVSLAVPPAGLVRELALLLDVDNGLGTVGGG